MVCGDFNLIYRAQDKNNSGLNRRMMNHFRHFIDEFELLELNLHSRLYKWSNEREDPTLERIDRVFVTEEWASASPNHKLTALSSEGSDHASLLIQTDSACSSFRRFRFKNIWPRYEGYMETIQQAWSCPWTEHGVDAFRVLDYKLQSTARALKSWSAKHVGSIRLQLAIAKELVLRFDCAQEVRRLAPHERTLRNKMKLCCLGLASAMRAVMRQHSRINYLAEGDVNTKFFHLQACHRNKKNHIESVLVDDMVIVHEEAKAQAIYNHFESIMGTTATSSFALDFTRLQIPTLDLTALDVCVDGENPST
jgi:hypothetical protein